VGRFAALRNEPDLGVADVFAKTNPIAFSSAEGEDPKFENTNPNGWIQRTG
jgi:hypothetical protein